MSETLAWAAGMIDGDGSIMVYRGVTRGLPFYSLRVLVGNTVYPVLLRMQDILGGKVYSKGPTTGRKPYWMWRVVGPEAQRALELLEPRLVAKRAQAQLGQLFLTGNPGRQRSWVYLVSQAIGYLAIKRLNGR